MDIYKKVKDLVEVMQNAELGEIIIKDGLREITLRRHATITGQQPVIAMQPGAIPVSQSVVASPQETAKTEAEIPARDKNVVEFKSPMVGTFYRAPSPESPPFTSEGEKIGKDTVICIVEAMKVMNELKAVMEGTVVDILVENGEAVEFGQPLLLIRVT